MSGWHISFEGILALHQGNFVAASQETRRGILRTTIRRYYHQFLTDEDDLRAEEELLQDEPEDGTSSLSPEEREAATHSKDAAFYKKEVSDWDVVQKLFKKEIDEYDKEEQGKLGVKNEIKYRTGHARDWFKNMTPAQRKEVENAREKWNKEGAPLESQTMYQKRHLKKILKDFTEQMHHTMGCQVMIIASHKKTADQTLNVIVHESKLVNKWSKLEFYLEENDDDSNDKMEDDGKASLPSHMRAENINHLWAHWEARMAAKKKLVISNAAKISDMSKQRLKNAVPHQQKTNKMANLAESDSSEDESAAAASMGRRTTTAAQPSSAQQGAPATVLMKNQIQFLKSLSSNDQHLHLVEGTRDLKKVQKFLATATSAKIIGLPSGMRVALGLGLLLRECKRIIKYEEDEVTLETPTYVRDSILDIKMLDLVIEAVEKVRGGLMHLLKSKDIQQEPAILDKVAHGDGLGAKDGADDSPEDSDKDEGENEDKEEAVVEVKGKKRMKSGGSRKPSKKAKGDSVEIWPALVLQVSYLPFEIWPAHALQLWLLWLVSFYQPAASHLRSGQHMLYSSGWSASAMPLACQILLASYLSFEIWPALVLHVWHIWYFSGLG
ncbi:hypothetical protein BDR07DRAFT_1378130 [Suillus spraguei]|nr:hypothetical protein BDR07DRAFT_1378130 [Suillus spraguei]